MKLLAFTDLHGSLSSLKKIEKLAEKENPDIIICAGDLSIFENGIEFIAYRLDTLGKPFLFIHGNHESQQVSKKIQKFFKNAIFIHNKPYKHGDCLFYGYGGGGFSLIDKEFEKDSKIFEIEIKENKDKKRILVTHAPPYDTKIDKVYGKHCGNKSIANFIKKNHIDIAISGHLHENFGKKGRIGNTKIINPGQIGEIINI